jgi:predicted metal-dependent phosphoesterase TrpH
MSSDRIDLHTHSSRSDGSLSPRQLVRFAKDKGLRAIALTDHDTVSGLEEALEAGKEMGVEVVPGVEISARHAPGTMHILGYYVCHTDAELVDALKDLQRARARRNPKIIDRLGSLGLEIAFDEVLALSGGQIGRPHIARALLDKGYVSSIGEAFNRYLGKGAPAYVEKFRFPPQQAIATIRNGGGLAVLAHPSTLGMDKPEDFHRLLADLQRMGLEGVEVLYPTHSDAMTCLYNDVARRLGLLCTGGSDFHGEFVRGPYWGEGKEKNPVDYALLQELKNRLKERKSTDFAC